MRYLLNFLKQYNYWFLFILLEAAGFFLLFRYNSYQQSVFLSSAGSVSGWVYRVTGNITAYFHLRAENSALLERNFALEREVATLEAALQQYQPDTTVINDLRILTLSEYELHSAHVINNSLTHADNFITLDAGSNAGIEPEMGVVGAQGVVGVVYKTSPSYSLVLSLLNSKSNLSCKIADSKYFGYLQWKPGDARFAYLRDLPRHAEFQTGDTVVTSGYSTIFPAGVMVGTVDEIADSKDGLSYLLKIKLVTDFGQINEVRVVGRRGRREQQALQQFINN